MTDWETRRAYIKALGDLKNALSREMDRAQAGQELARRDAHLRGLINDVEGYRIRIVREQEIEYEQNHPLNWDEVDVPTPPLQAL